MHPNNFQWTLAFILLALSQSLHLSSNDIIAHALRVYCSVIPRCTCPPHSPCFSFSHSQPVSLSPSLCPLLCQQCNFSLQLENRCNRGSLFNKGIKAKRRDEREKGSALGGIYTRTHARILHAHVHTAVAQTIRREHRNSHLLISEELVVRCFPI